MDNIVKSVRQAIADGNLYGALFISLTLPDICSKLEKPGINTNQRYPEWFEKYMTEYRNFMPGKDAYALRCSLLHEGRDNITNQSIRESLEYYVFMTDGPHLSLVKNCWFNNEKKTFLQLRVDKFCEDLCVGVEGWLEGVKDTPEIVSRLSETIQIHPPGYAHFGIKFG